MYSTSYHCKNMQKMIAGNIEFKSPIPALVQLTCLQTKNGIAGFPKLCRIFSKDKNPLLAPSNCAMFCFISNDLGFGRLR